MTDRRSIRMSGAAINGNHGARAISGGLILVATLLLLWGCRHHHSDSGTTVISTPTSFRADTEFFWEDDTDVYSWDTSLSDVDIEVRIRHFFDGFLRLRIIDADEVEVFDEIYVSDDDYDDDEILRLATITGATPGNWEIRLQAVDLRGHVYLIFD